MKTAKLWSCPDSKLILPANAGRDRWLHERRKGIGGSDVSAVFGFNQYASGYGVWLDKKGLGNERGLTAPMRWGKLLEPAMRQAFTEDTGIEVRSCGLMRSKVVPIMQTTPDGLTSDGGYFESKATSGWKADEWADDQIPDHAELQVQHGMGVTGRTHAWVTGLIDGRDFVVRRVERDQAIIDALMANEAEWWETYIVGDTPPPVTAYSLGEIKDQFRDEDDDDIVLDPDVVRPIRERIEHADERIKFWKNDKAAAEADFRLLAGPHLTVTVEGKTYATLKSTGTFAGRQFQDNDPDVAKDFMRTASVVDTARLKIEKPETYNHYRSRVLRFAATPKEK